MTRRHRFLALAIGVLVLFLLALIGLWPLGRISGAGWFWVPILIALGMLDLWLFGVYGEKIRAREENGLRRETAGENSPGQPPSQRH